MIGASGNVLFVRASSEDFESSKKTKKTFSLLKQTIEALGLIVQFTEEGSKDISLADIDIIVAGIPEYLRGALDASQIEGFLADGGSVLLFTNADIMINPPASLHEIAAISSARFKEYLNAPAPFITRFFPHWITANVNLLEPGKIASLSLLSDSLTVLAETDIPIETFMVCNSVGNGRIVLVGNETWLRDDLITRADHLTLIRNIFVWLSKRNKFEIENLTVPDTAQIEQQAFVTIQLKNTNPDDRINLKCTLDSDAGAIIPQPVREKRGLPFGQTSEIRWQIQPQKLGDQKLRLIIEQEEDPTLFFDRLPELVGTANGYLTLELKNNLDKPQTEFRTGDNFIAEGAFHSSVPISFSLYESLELELSDGLIQRAFEPGTYKSRWYIQAAKAGCYQLLLRLKGTNQKLPAQIKVHHSLPEQIEEINTAIQLPLNAEIAARLKQIDLLLSDVVVQDIPFYIVTLDDYIVALYRGDSAARLAEIVQSARREQWFNPELLKIILTYFLPTYVPNQGVYIPFDPDLASSLAKLHPRDRRFLENNLLCSNESSGVLIKQNIAAYLLHERYGHGFFYKHTILGQQLETLHKNTEKYKAVIKLIDDSSTIVNEGFATWLELHLLNKLGEDIRPAINLRRDLLLEQSRGMFDLALKSQYLELHPPQHDSPYKEGFEYFDFISTAFHSRCAVQVMRIANSVDFGIKEDQNGEVMLTNSESQIEANLLESKSNEMKSDMRLREIARFLKANKKALIEKTRNQFCPFDCIGSGCPLEKVIEDKFQWRIE